MNILTVNSHVKPIRVDCGE